MRKNCLTKLLVKYLEIHSKINKYLEIKLKAAGHHRPLLEKECGGYAYE
jgi:hypothetical protein